MIESFWFWIYFNLFILFLLALDLFVIHRISKEISVKQALLISLGWIILALLFNLLIYHTRGSQDALNFFIGYLIEYSLSVDNLFIFLIIFNYFHVPNFLLHKVLFWGVLGAILMRAIFILVGITLVNAFHWTIYLFGIFLIFTGIKLLGKTEARVSLDTNFFLKIICRFLPVTSNYEGDRFFIRRDHRLWVTPLFLVLLVIETTDLIFAIDSIPAIIAITRDPFIVYTSNIFAILGLRTLYFALSGIMPYFHFLHYGLAFILIFIGSKMLLEDLMTVPVLFSLMFIIGVLVLSVILSIFFPQKNKI